jgi:hypothetical protein
MDSFPNGVLQIKLTKYPNYYVDNLGNVWSFKCNRIKILKPDNSARGYSQYTLFLNNKKQKVRGHRLVAETFIPNLNNKPQIDHINRIKDDNRLCNIRWATPKENQNNRSNNIFLYDKYYSKCKRIFPNILKPITP